MLAPIIKWWDISEEHIKNTVVNNRLIRLCTETPSGCNLKCPVCFVKKWNEKLESIDINIPDKIKLIIEAKKLWVEAIDIVWAWEPTIHPILIQMINKTRKLSMKIIVFSNWATKFFEEKNIEKFLDVSFVIKLWSLTKKQNDYVWVDFDYLNQRNETLKLLIKKWFTRWETMNLNWINRIITKVGADILVMKSNIYEIPDIFRYCRENNIMPMVKTFIPFDSSTPDDECPTVKLDELRIKLRDIDEKEFWIKLPKDFMYPQSTNCIQRVWWVYVTNEWKIYSCVGTKWEENNAPIFIPWKWTLKFFIKDKKKSWFWCEPRLINYKARWINIPKQIEKSLLG